LRITRDVALALTLESGHAPIEGGDELEQISPDDVV
jgi:hypothetical protein